MVHFNTLTRVNWRALVVVVWSASLPSIPTMRVRIQVKSTYCSYSVKLFEKEAMHDQF